MGGAARKQYLTLDGLPLLVLSLKVLQRVPSIREIILSVPKDDKEYCWQDIVKPFGLGKVLANCGRRTTAARFCAPWNFGHFRASRSWSSFMMAFAPFIQDEISLKRVFRRAAQNRSGCGSHAYSRHRKTG